MPTHNDETLQQRYEREHQDFERMSEHTPGRLEVAVEVFDNDGCPETVIQGMGGAASVAVALDFGPNNPNMRYANARRLVAAWNACEGISTEHLEAALSLGERIVEFRRTGITEAQGLLAQRDELLAALKLAQQIIGHPDDDHSKLIAEVIQEVEQP